MAFLNRSDAGRRLALLLEDLAPEHPVVEGMARGGVPVAFEIAAALDAPLDVVVVRKLGHPNQPELGLGAIGESGVHLVNAPLVEQLGVAEDVIAAVAARERTELDRRLRVYRGDRPPVPVGGRTAIVVDDGLATGYTARAAVEVMRRRGARRVVLAVPVGPPGAVEALGAVADEVVCCEVTEQFFGISEWYVDFHQVSDQEVARLVAVAARRRADDDDDPPLDEPRADDGAAAWSGTSGAPLARPVEVPVGAHRLPGELSVPDGALGLVLFAHGSGSSRSSPRNQSVARVLQHAGMATLLFDLLTPDEARDRANVFDVAELGLRLATATTWVRSTAALRGLPVGFFGASTGAAAALVAAARPGIDVRAVVSRGGRPDLAGDALRWVRAPTLLIVGGDDTVVLELNAEARSRLQCESRLEVVAGATHLFEEPGALEAVASLASAWFTEHLAPGGAPG